MDIINVFFIISVAVAGTAAMTWVPAYRKGVKAGVRAERNRLRAQKIKMRLNAEFGQYAGGKILDVNNLYPSEFLPASNVDGHDV